MLNALLRCVSITLEKLFILFLVTLSEGLNEDAQDSIGDNTRMVNLIFI